MGCDVGDPVGCPVGLNVLVGAEELGTDDGVAVGSELLGILLDGTLEDGTLDDGALEGVVDGCEDG